ncbi:hypothetical protein HRR83_005792 [Exophiala dermatitidis]|uniref:Uncharacterized protein n=1 Tax=Exophiala dermatitidis TaxID=5970 RepID=A0AAN6EN92_EXODE|nr:hypothetical protein HRR73_007367 [Exophiala dermatitidis]KAJ4513348.1 hypothetical protein HRR74_006160 [Exophiala dermatitidis]KAJ4538100.1 hypothetical protein HRR77_007140 [Exophiala dermatitidis]KAJ4539834.1 hypothetical protein HRR76_003267 [Exophiala dermatitidis]KAJ4562392.1 hypothetical protein HRR79_006719 [Exophiala dermatitidis]
MLFLWCILACCNLLVALRAPICRDLPVATSQSRKALERDEQNWKYGMHCRLHRAIVGLSVVMALSMCLLCLLDRLLRRITSAQTDSNSTSTCSRHSYKSQFRNSFWCWRFGFGFGPRTSISREHNAAAHHGSIPSLSSTGTAGSQIYRDDGVFPVHDRRPSRLEHEQWLQRRNSLSSQKAIYPHKYHHHHNTTSSWHLRHPYSPSPHYHPGYFPAATASSSRYSSTLRSVSEGALLDVDLTDSHFTFNPSLSLSLSSSNSNDRLSGRSLSCRTPVPRRPSTLSMSFSSSSLRQTQRRGSNRYGYAGPPGQMQSCRLPDHLSTPTITTSLVSSTTLADGGGPPLPAAPAPTWSPALHHAPLSADPTIRALSTGVRVSKLSGHGGLGKGPVVPPRSTSAMSFPAQGKGTQPVEGGNRPPAVRGPVQESASMPACGTAAAPPGPQPVPSITLQRPPPIPTMSMARPSRQRACR